MSEMLTIETEHQFYYASDQPVTAKALAESLLGLDALVKQSVRSVCTYIGINAVETEVIIESVEIASYKDNFWVRLVFGKGDDIEVKIDNLREVLGFDKLDSMDITELPGMRNKFIKSLIGVGIAGGLTYGAYLHFKPITPSPAANVTIENHFTNSFNTIGSDMRLSGEDVQKIVSAGLSASKIEGLKKTAVKVLKPDGQVTSGTVTIDGKANLVIPKEVVDQVPTDYEKPVSEAQWEAKNNVNIEVRALDLDSTDKGWLAIIPEISGARVRLTLGNNVDSKSLPSGVVFQGDIIVIYKANGKTPKEYQLIEKK